MNMGSWILNIQYLMLDVGCSMFDNYNRNSICMRLFELYHGDTASGP